MSAQHTAGLLEVAANYPHGLTAICHHDGKGWRGIATANTEADARRLVACWNACDGISTEALESAGNAFNGWKLASYAMDDAKAQRDELLAALQNLIAWHDAEHNDNREAIDNARAAIAKATA